MIPSLSTRPTSQHTFSEREVWELLHTPTPTTPPVLGRADSEELEVILNYPFKLAPSVPFTLSRFLKKMAKHPLVQDILIIGGAAPISNETCQTLAPNAHEKENLKQRIREWVDVDLVFEMKEMPLDEQNHFIQHFLENSANGQPLDNFFHLPDKSATLISFAKKLDFVFLWGQKHQNFLFEHESAFVSITPYLLGKGPPVARCLSDWTTWAFCQSRKLLYVQNWRQDPAFFPKYAMRLTQGFHSLQYGMESEWIAHFFSCHKDWVRAKKLLDCLYLHSDKTPETTLAFFLNVAEIFQNSDISHEVLLTMRSSLKQKECVSGMHQKIAHALLENDPFVVLNDLKLFLILGGRNEIKQGLQEGETSIQWKLSTYATVSFRIDTTKLHTPTPLFFQLAEHVKPSQKIPMKNGFTLPNPFAQLVVALSHSSTPELSHLGALTLFCTREEQLDCLNFLKHHFDPLPENAIKKWIDSKECTKSSLFRVVLHALLSEQLEWVLQNFKNFSLNTTDLLAVETLLLKKLAEKNPVRAKRHWNAWKKQRHWQDNPLFGIELLAEKTDMTEEITENLSASPLVLKALAHQDPHKAYPCLQRLCALPNCEKYPLLLSAAKKLAKTKPEWAHNLLLNICSDHLTHEERQIVQTLFPLLQKSDWQHPEMNSLWKVHHIQKKTQSIESPKVKKEKKRKIQVVKEEDEDAKYYQELLQAIRDVKYAVILFFTTIICTIIVNRSMQQGATDCLFGSLDD